jgi:hypothetical protein
MNRENSEVTSSNASTGNQNNAKRIRASYDKVECRSRAEAGAKGYATMTSPTRGLDV